MLRGSQASKRGPGRDSSFLAQIAICRLSVAVEPSLAGTPTALAVAPVIESQKAQAEPAETGVVYRAVELREVSRIAVTHEQPETTARVCGRNHPAYQSDPVLRGNLHPLGGKIEPGRRRQKTPLLSRRIDQAGFGQAQENPPMAAIDGNPQTGWGVSFGEQRNAFLALRFAGGVRTEARDTVGPASGADAGR